MFPQRFSKKAVLKLDCGNSGQEVTPSKPQLIHKLANGHNEWNLAVVWNPTHQNAIVALSYMLMHLIKLHHANPTVHIILCHFFTFTGLH